MLRGARLVRTIGLARTLALAYAASAVRWAVCAFVREPVVLIAVQLLHAFSYGAWYLAGVALVERESPREVRASAQGIFGAFSSGLATTVALAIAGWMESHGGMRAVFSAGAVAAVVAAVVAIGLGDLTPGAGAPPRLPSSPP
jgi:PPP family 3-phenylpropionic acid transporter